MPVWDTVCTNGKCKKIERDVLIVHSQELPVCDACGSERKKLMGAPAFKIEGWSAENGYSDVGIAYGDYTEGL